MKELRLWLWIASAAACACAGPRPAAKADPRFAELPLVCPSSQVYRQKGDDAQVIAWAGKSAALAPRNHVAHQTLANAWRRAGRADDALAEYATLEQLDPRDPEAFYGRAQVLLEARRFAEALSAARRAGPTSRRRCATSRRRAAICSGRGSSA